MTASYELTDRVAIVTGGARGIGRAVAEELHGNGARIAIWDVDLAVAREAAAALGGQDTAMAFDCDQADWVSVQAAAATTSEHFGRIDILVNNAGIAGANATVVDYPQDEWVRVIAIDLTGVFHCCKAVTPHLVQNGWGRIVNVASVAGKDGNPNASAYSAAKAGVIALTKSLGKELASTGVLVNAITPAAVKTEIFDQMSEEHIAYMLSKIPMGRFGKVEENAALIAWLCSPECSFSTGGIFDISGGRSTY